VLQKNLLSSLYGYDGGRGHGADMARQDVRNFLNYILLLVF